MAKTNPYLMALDRWEQNKAMPPATTVPMPPPPKATTSGNHFMDALDVWEQNRVVPKPVVAPVSPATSPTLPTLAAPPKPASLGQFRQLDEAGNTPFLTNKDIFLLQQHNAPHIKLTRAIAPGLVKTPERVEQLYRMWPELKTGDIPIRSEQLLPSLAIQAYTDLPTLLASYMTGGSAAVAGLTSKVAPRAGTLAPKALSGLSLLQKEAARGIGAGATYGGLTAAAEGQGPAKTARTMAGNALLFGAGDPAVVKGAQLVGRYVKGLTEPLKLPQLGRLNLTKQYPQLPPGNVGLLPEFASDPAGVVRARGITGRRLLPEPEADAALRAQAEQLGYKWPLSTQQRAEVQLYKVLDDITQPIKDRGIVPYESKRSLINFVHEGLGGSISKKEVRRLNYEQLADMAEDIVKENPPLMKLAQQEADKRGVNLDDLFKTASDPEHARWKEVVGLAEPPPKPLAPRLPAQPTAELDAARNILPNIQKPARAQKILQTFPELKREFPKLGKQLEKPPVVPKAGRVPNAEPAQKTAPMPKQEPAQAEPVKKSSLRDLETIAGAIVDKSVGDVKPAIGMQIRMVGKKADTDASPVKFDDPNIEARWNAANGIQKESLLQRTKAGIKDAIAKATREFEFLPRTGEYSEARYVLSNMQKQRDITSDRTLRLQQYILLDQNKADHDLFRRKVILDDLVSTDGELPFGFTRDTLTKELAKVDAAVKNNPKVAEAVAKRKAVWSAIKDEYVDALGDIGFDVSERFNRKDYYRHQILEYVNNKERRGFMKQRLGSSKDINTNYLQAEYEVMAQMLHDIEIAKGLKRIGDKYNIRPKLEQGLKQGEKLSDSIPRGYVKWQPRQGGLFHLADSIPFRVAERMYREAMQELGLSDKELKRAMVKSGHFDYWVVKEEVAKTLDGLVKKQEIHPLASVSREALRKWKVWTLVSPRRWFKYNARNISGDADAMFAGNPSAFKKLPQATKELYRVYAGDGAMTPTMRDWFERGGMQTLLQAQELGDINHLKMFVNLMEKKGGPLELPVRAWQGYWKAARMSTDFREALLRYSAYLDYLDQMKGDGRPKNFGASIPDEVMALTDIKDRAFKLSNELLGAYDQVSVIGQALRDHLMPFWSWNEVNFRRYKQLIVNAANDGRLSHALGRKFMTTAVKSPLVAYRVGKLAAKASALWIMLDQWNVRMYPDLEAKLSREERERPHIILGKDDEGKTIYFGRLGALQDFVNWFGVDAASVQDVRDILNGKKSVKEIATEMAKEPANKLAQGLSPLYKTPAELVAGQKYFPDIFKPGRIRDRGLHVAQSLGLENEYKAVMGLPSRPYGKTMQDLFIYTQDPAQTAYYDIIDAKYRFKEKQGKGSSGVFRSPKGDALYNYKLALKLKDKEAAKRYLQEYINLGGTGDGLERSLESMHPLYGLNEADRIAFVRSLDDEEKAKLEEAVNYYKDVLMSR